jgi:hypothetical protein
MELLIHYYKSDRSANISENVFQFISDNHFVECLVQVKLHWTPFLQFFKCIHLY